jgi:hypothetical protein
VNASVAAAYRTSGGMTMVSTIRIAAATMNGMACHKACRRAARPPTAQKM